MSDDNEVGARYTGAWLAFLATVSVLFFILLIPSPASGFRIEQTGRGSCVFLILGRTPDPALFCSDDIFAVEDALRRYRSMPLGTLKRHK